MNARIGSGLSSRLAQKVSTAGWQAVHVAVAGIVIVTLVYAAILPELFSRWMALDDTLRIGLSLGLIAPLALFMGMPFPLGLKRINETIPEFIPWAWGINGFASVISAALAILLAISFGFTTVLIIAMLFYAVAALIAPRN